MGAAVPLVPGEAGVGAALVLAVARRAAARRAGAGRGLPLGLPGVRAPARGARAAVRCASRAGRACRATPVPRAAAGGRSSPGAPGRAAAAAAGGSPSRRGRASGRTRARCACSSSSSSTTAGGAPRPGSRRCSSRTRRCAGSWRRATSSCRCRCTRDGCASAGTTSRRSSRPSSRGWAASRTGRARSCAAATPPRRPGAARPSAVATWRARSRCEGAAPWPGAWSLVVDDVVTTGATARACARALVSAGAAEVRLLTVARA